MRTSESPPRSKITESQLAAAMSALSLPGEVGRVFVTPVPTTAERLRTRGYNQAGKLAECFAAGRSLPVVDLLSLNGEIEALNERRIAYRKRRFRQHPSVKMVHRQRRPIAHRVSPRKSVTNYESNKTC